MGINGLNKFLRQKCPSVFVETHLSEFRYKKCAVDISLFIFKYKTIFGDDWLASIINLVCCLKRNQIHACFIYDTSAPVEKQAERQERKDKRVKLEARILALEEALEKAKTTNCVDQILYDLIKEEVKPRLLLVNKPRINLAQVEEEIQRIKKQVVCITKKDIDDTKNILDLLGVPHFQANMEAETTCADLCIRGDVDMVISEDTDVLAYECPVFCTKINTGTDTCVIINYNKVLEELDFTKEQFLDFCIMCGTDYNENIFKIGPVKSYNLIKTHKTIDSLKLPDISCLNHVRCRELFREYQKFDGKIPYCKPFDYNGICEFLFVNNIKFNSSKIKKDFEPAELIFEE